MNVLHVIATDQRRGAEVFADDLGTALARRGVEQRSLVLRPDGTARAPEPAMRLVRELRRSKPDIIQAHGGEALKWCATVAPRTPIVYRRIGGAPASLHAGIRRRAYGHLMRRATKIVAVADAVRNETISLFHLAESSVVTIPNAAEPLRLRASKCPERARLDLGLPPYSIVVLSMGALTWEKDPLALIEVAERVLREVPRAVFVFVGEGPLRSQVEERARISPLGSRIRVLGERRDVGDVFAAAHVLLFSSRSDGMEGMPAVLIEAGLSATPAVAYDVAGVAEVIVDRVTGLLVPERNPEQLAAATVGALTHPRFLRWMGRQAKERCYDRFTIERVAPQYLELYERVLAR